MIRHKTKSQIAESKSGSPHKAVIEPYFGAILSICLKAYASNLYYISPNITNNWLATSEIPSLWEKLQLHKKWPLWFWWISTENTLNIHSVVGHPSSKDRPAFIPLLHTAIMCIGHKGKTQLGMFNVENSDLALTFTVCDIRGTWCTCMSVSCRKVGIYCTKIIPVNTQWKFMWWYYQWYPT